MCQRERKRHWVVRRVWPCVLRFCAVDHFILRGRHLWVLKHHSDYVRGKICFKEIVLNTKLNLIHSSFMHLVCKFLIILHFLLYMQYIFIVLPITSFVLILLIIRSVCFSFYFITKVNCWNISNNIYIYIYIISYHIILYIYIYINIIKVRLRSCGCATWFHQIVKILLDF